MDTSCRSQDNLDQAYGTDKQTLDVPDSNDVLMANIYVHKAADYYQISELMEHARTKFTKAAADFRQFGFANVVTLLYDSDSTTAQELGPIVCSIIARYATTLMVDGAFMDVVAELPGFIKALLPTVVAEYECRLESEKSLHATSLEEAKTRIVELNEMVQAAKEETAQTRKRVNDAKSCRKCYRACTISFDDKPPYSLRCICNQTL
jgi:hypothetical protein